MGSRIKAFGVSLGVALSFALACKPASAGRLSAYLPLNLEPEMERQIERVLILARRAHPQAADTGRARQAALPQACTVDKPLCTKVKRYLERYSRDYAVTHASATAGVTHGDDVRVLPNAYGMPNDSH